MDRKWRLLLATHTRLCVCCVAGLNDPYHIKIGEAASNGPEDRASFYGLHLGHKKRGVTQSSTAEQVETSDVRPRQKCDAGCVKKAASCSGVSVAAPPGGQDEAERWTARLGPRCHGVHGVHVDPAWHTNVTTTTTRSWLKCARDARPSWTCTGFKTKRTSEWAEATQRRKTFFKPKLPLLDLTHTSRCVFVFTQLSLYVETKVKECDTTSAH